MSTSPEAKQAADVDKIARGAVIKLQDSCIQLDPRITMTVMREAIAQARAPLVGALEQIRDSGEGQFDATTGEGHARCRKLARAALTGTGEK